MKFHPPSFRPHLFVFPRFNGSTIQRFNHTTPFAIFLLGPSLDSAEVPICSSGLIVGRWNFCPYSGWWLLDFGISLRPQLLPVHHLSYKLDQTRVSLEL